MVSSSTVKALGLPSDQEETLKATLRASSMQFQTQHESVLAHEVAYVSGLPLHVTITSARLLEAKGYLVLEEASNGDIYMQAPENTL